MLITPYLDMPFDVAVSFDVDMHGLLVAAGLMLTVMRTVWGGIFTSDLQVRALVDTAHTPCQSTLSNQPFNLP